MHPPQAPGQMAQMSSAYPGTQMFMPLAQSVPVGPVGHNVPMAYYPMGAVYPPGSTVLIDGGFDAGARFGAGSAPSIPVSSVSAAFSTRPHFFFPHRMRAMPLAVFPLCQYQ